MLRTLAKQLRIEVLDQASAYSTGRQRWQHAIEIRARYCYVELTDAFPPSENHEGTSLDSGK